MNHQLDYFFWIFLSIAMVMIVTSFFAKDSATCNKKICIDRNCNKGVIRRWSIFLCFIFISWYVVRISNSDAMESFADWTIILSLAISLVTCIVLYKRIIGYFKKGERPFLLVNLPLGYFGLFFLFLIIELEKGWIVDHLGPSFSQYEVLYSASYLWAYVAMMYVYIRQLRKQQAQAGDSNDLNQELTDFKLIINRIDLPIALSFTFFALIFFVLGSHSDDLIGNGLSALRKSAIFGIGGSSLHILTSSFLFLYEYSEEYFGIKFIKVS